MSHLLLDSHILYWYDEGDRRLPAEAVYAIEHATEVYVSAVSVWELTIKRMAGKLPEQDLIKIAKSHGFHLLSVSPEHAAAIAALPRHHRDPFDHLLLAQAKVEGLTLVTHDTILSKYGVPVLLV